MFVFLAGALVVLGGCDRAPSTPVPASVPVMPAGGQAEAFPLRAVPGHRCLADQGGKSVFMQGDAAWSLLVRLRREDVTLYLGDRARRGYNTVLVNLIEHQEADDPPRNAYGEPPFLDGGAFGAPNEKYFAHVDWVLQRAAERGFVVLLAPSYLGYEGGTEGWYGEMRAAGKGKLRAYGRYLGTRYRHMANVIWVHGGDYNAPDRGLVEAVLEGMKEADPGALHTFHGARGTAARAYLGEATPWLNLNTVYTDENGVVDAAAREYGESPLPFILIEGRYEDMGATPAMVRAQAYQAVLSGACGHVAGNKFIWPFINGWKDALDSGGSRGMGQLARLASTLHWPELRPAPGGFIASDPGVGIARAVAAFSVPEDFAVAYVPRGGRLVVDLDRLPGAPASFEWRDPTNGAIVPARRMPSAGSDRLVASTPGRNAAGDDDWLLLIKIKQHRN